MKLRFFWNGIKVSTGKLQRCEQDRIRVSPDHPLYAEVRAAWEARKAHYEKRFPMEAA